MELFPKPILPVFFIASTIDFFRASLLSVCMNHDSMHASPVISANTVIGNGSLASASIGATIVDILAKILQMPIAVPAKIEGNS